MFDILDDNYNLSSGPNILSSSKFTQNKKSNPKENKSPIRPQSNKSSYSKNKQFDDLLDGVLAKQSRNSSHFADNFSASTSQRNKLDTIDLNFQQTGKSKFISPKNSIPNSNFARTSIFDSDIVGDDHGINYQFGRTQQTIFNPSKIEQSFVSTRNMKPPIRRKDSQPNQSFNFGVSNIGIPIPEEDATITNSSYNKNDQEIIRPPLRSVNRRSSIDARSQINDEVAVPSLRKSENHNSAIEFDYIKQDFKNTKENIHSALKHPHTEMNISTLKQKQVKYDLGQKKEQVSASKEVEERIAQSNKIIVQNYDRKIDILKETYQKQIEAMQESLDKQIKENRYIREDFMKETTRIIEEERNRTKRVHEEEINRLKEMFNWEKKRIEQTLNCQIESLKQSLEYSNRIPNYNSNNQQKSRDQFDFMEYEIKSKKQGLEDKERMLERREQDLEYSQNQLNKRCKREEDRFRAEEKRLMEMELKYKKLVLDQKKNIYQEKQQMAQQMGDMQMQTMKMKQKMQLGLKQIQMERQAIEREREEVRRMSNEIILRYSTKLQQLQSQKETVKDIELELTQKIRTVEMRAKQIMYSTNNQEDFSINWKKTNNWLEQDRNQNALKLRPSSASKNSNSMTNIMKTKQRYVQLERNSKSKLNLSIKQTKHIDLSSYMTKIDQIRSIKADI